VVNPSYRVRWPAFRKAMFRAKAWQRLPRRWADALDRVNRAPMRYPPMDEGLRAELLTWFAGDNAALKIWLGRELPAWKR
jgi:hypothetical protein